MTYDYIKLIQEREIIENRLYLAEQEIKYKMLQDGVNEIKTKSGTISLQAKRKRKKLEVTPTLKEVEINQAIIDRTNKVIEENKEKIYSLEKVKFIAENELRNLLNFVDLQDEIVEERKASYSKKLDFVEELSIKFKHSKDFYLQSIDKEVLSNMYSQSDKAKVKDFSKKFFLGYYPDLPIEKAWESYLSNAS